jgi:16S rRNA (adenine(1408)-N(1))-methyltransferase
MVEGSARAARPTRKGGLRNLLFAVASAERPPDELCGRVDEITVLFPWGSLLRGALAIDPVAAAGIAGLVAPGGVVRALVSVTDRDTGATDLRPLTAADADAIRGRWAAFGLGLMRFQPATAEEIAASGSTWARRLVRGRRELDRPVWNVELRCSDGEPRIR